NKVIGPARPPVWGLHQFILSLPHAPGDEHNGIRMPDVLWYPRFDIHGAMHRFVAGLPHVMAAHVEMTFAPDSAGRKGRDRRIRGASGGLLGVHHEPATGKNYGQR